MTLRPWLDASKIPYAPTSEGRIELTGQWLCVNCAADFDEDAEVYPCEPADGVYESIEIRDSSGLYRLGVTMGEVDGVIEAAAS